jgi:IclR family acetate operon transcriptional repressor
VRVVSTSPAAPPREGSTVERRSSSAGVQTSLSVLELLGTRGSLSLSELARELGLPKSTVHRICAVLVDRYWVVRDDSGRFELGVRAFGLAAHSSELPIVVAFRGVAAELLTRHDETVCLAVLDGDDSVFVALEETSHPVRLVTRVGSRTPAFASASGRVILAARPAGQLAATFEGRPLVTPTGRRLNGVAELHAILDEVRKNGVAENHDETAIGLYTASVPVRNAEGVVLAALTVCVPTSRLTPERRERIVADLADAGRRLSELVSWLPAVTVRP